jgi:hypothetical protein
MHYTEKLICDMTIRNMAQTKIQYLNSIKGLSKYYMTDLSLLTDDEVQR